MENENLTFRLFPTLDNSSLLQTSLTNNSEQMKLSQGRSVKRKQEWESTEAPLKRTRFEIPSSMLCTVGIFYNKTSVLHPKPKKSLSLQIPTREIQSSETVSEYLLQQTSVKESVESFQKLYNTTSPPRFQICDSRWKQSCTWERDALHEYLYTCFLQCSVFRVGIFLTSKDIEKKKSSSGKPAPPKEVAHNSVSSEHEPDVDENGISYEDACCLSMDFLEAAAGLYDLDQQRREEVSSQKPSDSPKPAKITKVQQSRTNPAAKRFFAQKPSSSPVNHTKKASSTQRPASYSSESSPKNASSSKPHSSTPGQPSSTSPCDLHSQKPAASQIDPSTKSKQTSTSSNEVDNHTTDARLRSMEDKKTTDKAWVYSSPAASSSTDSKIFFEVDISYKTTTYTCAVQRGVTTYDDLIEKLKKGVHLDGDYIILRDHRHMIGSSVIIHPLMLALRKRLHKKRIS